jgi:hypothetical protein
MHGHCLTEKRVSGIKIKVQLAVVFGMFKTSWSASPPCVVRKSTASVGLSNLKNSLASH